MRLSPLQETRGAKLLPYLATALIALFVTIFQYQFLSLEAWTLPSDYYGDALETLTRLKAASEGDALPLLPQRIDRLGAPFGAQWNAYPTSDRLIMLSLGLLAKLTGLMAAANIGLVIAQVSAALSCLWVLRYLRCRWEWAIASSLLFAFTYNAFNRGLAHYAFVFTWTIPIGVLAATLVLRAKRITWFSREFWLCMGIAVIFGAQNPYYHFFWLLLMGWAVLLQLFGERRGMNLKIGLLTIAVSFLSFFVFNIEYWLYTAEPQALPLLVRNYGGTERYALKPVEMFIPPSVHRWDVFSFLGHRYQRWSEWRGEFYLPYLGLVGIGALVWLSVLSFGQLGKKKPLPNSFLSIGWLLSFCTIGGLTNVLAFFAGFQVFRATNRVAIFISCILLLFLALRLSRQCLRLPRWLSITAACALLTLGLLDQIPRQRSGGEREFIAKKVRSDQSFAKEMEAALPAGSMVFQLPVLGFPEVKSPYELTDYELFRPYLHTQTLRFSYGAAKLRSRSQWQGELAEMPLEKQIKTLESFGFAALYLNRSGFKDRGTGLLAELDSLGYKRRIQSQLGGQILVPLHPAPSTVLPLARGVTFGQGFYATSLEDTRWAYDDAVFSYHNPYAVPLQAELKLQASTSTPGTIELLLNEQALHRFRYDHGQPPQAGIALLLRPGVNIFKIRSDAKVLRRNDTMYSLRKIGIHKASITPLVPRKDSTPSSVLSH